ncbi:MAG: beta-ketoacyl-ACP synthase II [Thermodesulfobacteriota bacterium]|nr:beta-ketoacyl-ACP synthase II [Thermodesulfobacteriota bacterium]
MEKRRVVITGMGVVAPNGVGIDNFWDSLVRGRSGVRKITHFDASSYPNQIAAEVPNFEPTDYIDPKTAKRLDRFAHFCLASASMALQDAEIKIPVKDPYRFGVFVGTAIGGGETSENQHLIFVEKGLKRIAPFTVEAISTHSASGLISQSFIIKGPNTTISSGCNSGLDACYLAYNTIRMGDADVMIVSAGEAPITPYIVSVFSAVGVLSTQNGDPKGTVKPYDIKASGMVLGEGGGAIIIEELTHAINRGAKIYGEILGYSSLTEAYMFGTKTDKEVMAKAFKEALDKSHLNLKDIEYINSHGNGILEYDVGETESIKSAFGELAYKIPISSIKPVTGQSLSATGIYQVITGLLAMKNGIIPPTINHKNPAPGCDLNYVPHHFLKKDVNVAIMNAHGFGGRHTVLVVGKLNT